MYIMRNLETLEQRNELGERLGSVYLDVRKDHAMRLHYTSLFALRRLLFSLAALYLSDYPMFQVLLFQAFSLG